MATNLRLRAEAEAAVRAEAARTGRSQQELIRAAVDRYLGLGRIEHVHNDSEALVSTGSALPARLPFKEADVLLPLAGVGTEELLDRDERY